MSAMHDLPDQSLGAVLKTALDAVVVMRMDGTIAGWNDVAARTFGWSFEEAAGRRMSDMIIPHRYREAHEKGLDHFLATGEGPVLDRHFEIEALHRDGREMPVELSITRTAQFGEPVFLGFLRDISERRDAARRQELLIGELNHRAKNLLGVVAGIAHQTARASGTISEFSGAFSGRLSSLGKAYEIVSAAAWERASLRRLAIELLGSFAQGSGPQATIDGPDVQLTPRQVLSVSMVIHELLTNAIKYGALSSGAPGGHLRVTWSVEDDAVRFSWIESGLSGVRPPEKAGFGTKMIALTVSHELRGQGTMEWRDDGFCYCFSFKMD